MSINQGHSIGMYFMLAISALLFSFAKCLVETLALKYTTRDYWSRDCLLRPGKGCLYAFYHMACFVVSIPLGLLYLLPTG